MTHERTLGLRVRIVIAEPWGLAPDPGDPGRSAMVREVARSPSGRDGVLLELDDPVEFLQAKYRVLVALGRSDGAGFDALPEGDGVEVSLYGLPPGVSIEDPFDVNSWWRGGFGGIATLVPD